jgi:Flp pilus assembly protein TadB
MNWPIVGAIATVATIAAQAWTQNEREKRRDEQERVQRHERMEHAIGIVVDLRERIEALESLVRSEDPN